MYIWNTIKNLFTRLKIILVTKYEYKFEFNFLENISDKI